MEKYINKYISSIPENQRRAIEKILADISVVAPVGSSVAHTQVSAIPDYTPKLKSPGYNDFMKQVYVDLAALFEDSNSTFAFISSTEMRNKDFSARTRMELSKIKASLEGLKAIVGNRASAAAHENFYNAARLSMDGVEITPVGVTLKPISYSIMNSSGDISSVEKDVYPHIDQVEFVSLPDQDIEYNFGVNGPGKTTDVAQSLRTNRSILQRGNGSFWRDIFLADRPVVHYQGDKKYDGVLVVLRVNFSSSREINTLTIDPFTEREIEITKLRWQNIAGEWAECMLEDSSAAAAKGNTTIFIPNIKGVGDAIALEIWFLQRNYRMAKYLVGGQAFYENRVMAEYLYDDFASLEASLKGEELSSVKVIRTAQEVPRGTTHDEAMAALFAAEDPEAVAKDALDQVVKADVFISPYEYCVGAYSIEPGRALYATPSAGTILSHNTTSGYRADISSLSQVELNATFVEPDVSSVEFYVVDEENRIAAPIVPKGTTRWREHIEPTGFPDIYFDTLFPCLPDTLTLYRNGEVQTAVITQTDPTGAASSSFVATDVSPGADDVFSVLYTINHDDLGPLQRVATVVSLEDELDPYIKIESTNGGTIEDISRNVVTLSNYPYLKVGENIDEDYTTFPFTPDGIEWAIFADLDKVNQYVLDPSGFIPYMEVLDNRAPGKRWVLTTILPTGSAQLVFIDVETGTVMSTVPQEELQGVDEVIDLVAADAAVVGHIRIDWTAVEEWVPETYFNVTIRPLLYTPRTTNQLDELVELSANYGKGAAILPEVMNGILVGEDLSNSLRSMQEHFVASGAPIMVVIDGKIAEDITNYKEKYQDPLIDYEITGEYQYFVAGKKIFTNVNFDLFDKGVDVFYWFLTPSVKLESRFWTNRRGASMYTPILKDYTLHFRSKS